jgi:hypothetical protein
VLGTEPLPTAEVRWFGPDEGEAPRLLPSWFERGLRGPDAAPGIDVEDPRVDVLRRRRRRTYGVAGAGIRALPDPRSDRPEEGCDVELSLVEPGRGGGGGGWWTVCFEAFGDDPRAVLERVVPFAVLEPPGTALDAGRSRDYPAWLAEQSALT